MGRVRRLSFLLLASSFAFTNSALAEEAVSPAPKAVPGVEFTKIQDLNPNAKPTNRPIKQKWAVVIGTSRFKEGRLAPSEASDMAQSARDFEQYLVDPHGGRFEKNHVKLLEDAGTTRQAIMSAIGPNFLGNAAGPDDLVVVFVATSAFPTTDGSSYLCTYDCALDNIYGTCVSIQNLMSTLRQNVHSDRILLVLQAAYSGAAELGSGAKSLEKPAATNFNMDPAKVMLGNGFIILSSSQPNEITWSTAFSKNLTTALRQQDGLIGLPEAFEIAKKKTEEETVAAGPKRRQVPLMKSSWTGSELVLGAPSAEHAALPDSVNSFLSAEGAYLKASKAIADGKLDEALEQYKVAVSADPNYADALADWGAAMTIKNDWKGAADLLKKAVAMRPEDELYRLNYARVLSKLGEKEASAQELQTAYKLNAKDTSVLLALASLSLATNQPQDATKYLEQAVDLYPTKSEYRERLSVALMKSGDVGEASAQAKEAVRLDPKSVSAHTTLGSILMAQNYVGPAVEKYKEALVLDPRNDDVMWLLSRAMEKSGDREGAIDMLKQFLSTCSPADSRGLQAQERLKELTSR